MTDPVPMRTRSGRGLESLIRVNDSGEMSSRLFTFHKVENVGMTSRLPDTRTPLTVNVVAPSESITLRCLDKVVAPPKGTPNLSNADSLIFTCLSTAPSTTFASIVEVASFSVHTDRHNATGALECPRTRLFMTDGIAF